MTGRRYEIERVRADFPMLRRRLAGRRLAYLDSASSSQVPEQVLDAMRRHHGEHHANVGRGSHTLAVEAGVAYEAARASVAAFVGARPGEIVFTGNATEAVNLVAHAFVGRDSRQVGDPRLRLGPGDEIVVTEMEHHSNLVPWQLLCRRTGATLRSVPLTADGRLDLTDLDTIVNERTRLVAWVHVSNILGTANPVDVLVARAREVGALTLLDGSQSVPHRPVDVRALGVDFLAFTGHKMCGPTGIGALWGRAELLDALPPMLAGGGMVAAVELTEATFRPPPARFEAGTPPIVQAVGLGAAVDYLGAVGMAEVRRHESELTGYALDVLGDVPGVRILGPTGTADRGGVISFVLDGFEPDEVGRHLDAHGVQVRVGRHCAALVCRRYGVPGTVRASLHLYTDRDDIDALAGAVRSMGRRTR
ncbi:cysteine desulfurase / selenocysteine lyase [Micromonospora narathiwatensis]|uniref:Cysteine desulfurase n=2 Tax=Micromonospora narathiwatensis TaxID=299146 RepID=A0A1A8ZSC2_9ACTN|nr:SufS family cysteine desulfurase [Micromonospora narathiwatensis]SBT46724.1 cysteine desulfurase / selenocysteine lyase [Micromonospora narathiwatensis]